MENPIPEKPEAPDLQSRQILSPCSSGRRSSVDSRSPEFEFWMVRNPSFPQQNLLSADELFADGVLLPLDLLSNQNPDDPRDRSGELPPLESEPPPRNLEPDPEGAELGSDLAAPASASASSRLSSLSATVATHSKRWKDIFRKGDRSKPEGNGKNGDKEKEKKKERKNGGGGNVASSAELNINLWPFRRTRSAGNGGGRPRVAANRKVSSAPCSRSNSGGESKSRKWPSSPSRGGIHLGRNSPVWQVRRGGSGGRTLDPQPQVAKKEGNEAHRCKPSTSATAASGGATYKAKVLNLNVPMCIGYRSHLSCRSDDNSAVAAAAAVGSGGQSGGGSSSGDGGRGSTNLFNLKGLFTKKVY